MNAFVFGAHLLEMLKVEYQLGIILSPGRGKLYQPCLFLLVCASLILLLFAIVIYYLKASVSPESFSQHRLEVMCYHYLSKTQRFKCPFVFVTICDLHIDEILGK